MTATEEDIVVQLVRRLILGAEEAAAAAGHTTPTTRRSALAPIAYSVAVGPLLAILLPMGKECVPTQLAQCRFPGLAISNAEIQTYFQRKYTEAILSPNSTRNGLKLPKCIH